MHILRPLQEANGALHARRLARNRDIPSALAVTIPISPHLQLELEPKLWGFFRLFLLRSHWDRHGRRRRCGSPGRDRGATAGV